MSTSSLTPRSCLVPDCQASTQSPYTKKYGHLCHAHWLKLPMRLRKKWWDATNYGVVQPPNELLVEVKKELTRGISDNDGEESEHE